MVRKWKLTSILLFAGIMTPLRRRLHHNSRSEQSGKRLKQLEFDCSVTKEILGFTPSYQLDQSLLDSANSLLENGIVRYVYSIR